MRCPDYANTACFISNSTVNGETHLYRGCSPFNTDEISASNRLHDPVCNKWNNDENCKQQCDRDSFCNRGDMKNGNSKISRFFFSIFVL